MKKIIVAVPHSHTWFWTQTCITSLLRNPPVVKGYEVDVTVVDNSPWSPAIKGVTDTKLSNCGTAEAFNLRIISNHKTNKFHASALDCVVEKYDFDLLMALETDVMVLRSTWLQWFVNQMRPTDYAVGMWHHENFVNPSCTLYRGDVLRDMDKWCKDHPDPNVLRWGPSFNNTAPLDNNLPLNENSASALKNIKDWIAGPFAEKRGWPAGTSLSESPSGQNKGAGWYEPGQQLYHWAVEAGYTYTVCSSLTTTVGNVPVQTLYGSTMPDPQRQLEAVELFGNAEAVHLWGGTRAIDILKHPVTCEFVKSHTPGWLAREARFWKHVVSEDVQEQTMKLIREHGWHITGQGSDHVSDRDKAAAEYVKGCYERGGITW